jgi:cytidine deaminase
MDKKQLVISALEARDKAYAPYSHFKVGAALLAENGDIYTGCNIENVAFGPTNCAERTAFFKAVSEGVRGFVAIAVVGGNENQKTPEEDCYPCGVCRQVMLEFCRDDFEIIVATDPDHYTAYTLAQMMPLSFGKGNLQQD